MKITEVLKLLRSTAAHSDLTLNLTSETCQALARHLEELRKMAKEVSRRPCHCIVPATRGCFSCRAKALLAE